MSNVKSRTEAELARIAGLAPGRVGVFALHVESGHTLALNADEFFPMASTVKVPIAMAVLARVDKGELKLSDMVEVDPLEMNPSGPLGEEFLQPGVALSVINLMEPMITRSDNTATDVLLRLVNGPAGVQRYLTELRVEGIRPSRTIRDLLGVLYGIAVPAQGSMRDAIRALSPADHAAAKAKAQAPNPEYFDDERDQATPAGMVELLRRLWQRDGVSPRAHDMLVGIMGRTSTGVRRIAGRLPPGVKTADKTGSASGTTNDCGFIFLPGGAGTVALCVYVKACPLPAEEREVVIADLARTVYAHFIMTA